VVFGDIGTSPLYALKSILKDSGAVTRDDVYGVTSLVVWALVTVVGVLHVSVMLTADNEGQGGVLALAALLRRGVTPGRLRVAVSVAAMIGAALFLGDSILTPAISVLSASEGLEVAAPSMATWSCRWRWSSCSACSCCSPSAADGSARRTDR
jgi:KUP system potassium uptake protein